MAPPADSSHEDVAHTLFDRFLQAKSCEQTLGAFQDLSKCLDLQPEPEGQLRFYQKLKSRLSYWKAKAVWSKLDKKAGHAVYKQGKECAKTRCLVVGAGPCGLRTAIELAFLGAKVIVVEKRKAFSRNNVLHLWPFSIQDLRALGAKKYHGRFCTGTLDHVSIRQLQLILLKTALLLGVEVFVGIKFKEPVPPPVATKNQGRGWTATLQPRIPHLDQFQFDVLISAGGSKFVPEGFRRKELRGKLAIGITANFVNRHTAEEVKVAEISGVARIYNQKFFKDLLKQTGIDLENIVYYKDDTHYFVMTAKKQSLLKMGVIVQDLPDTEHLLSSDNVNAEALFKYAQDAANFSTRYQLPQMDFALNHHQRPDVDMFDFTCMYRAENAALVRERNGARLLIGLVGDCLVEPFWPLGTGVARGFLAAYDAAWMVKKWASGAPPLEVLAERESIYQHLSQTTPDNTNKNIAQYSIDPASRYPNINFQSIKPSQVRHLYDTGHTERDHGKAETNAKRSMFSRQDTISVYEELLSWCKKQTAGYPGVAVTDLTHSWQSGLALCALIHRFRPHLIDFNSLDQNAAVPNNQLAFDLAQHELGILPILTATEMSQVSEPDRLTLVTYLSQFYEAFKDEPLLPSPPPVYGEPDGKRPTLSSAKSAILFLNKLQKTLSLKRNTKGLDDLESETKRKKSGESPRESLPRWSSESTGSPVNWPSQPDQDNAGSSSSQPMSLEIDGNQDSGQSMDEVFHSNGRLDLIADGQDGARNPSSGSQTLPHSPDTRGKTLKGQTLSGSSDACYFCGQRVYIVERVSAEGFFFHRGCFRCHQCDATLRLGNYAFNENDGYFYCMIHMDENFQPPQHGLFAKGLDDANTSPNGTSLCISTDKEQRVPIAVDISSSLQPLDSGGHTPSSSGLPDSVSPGPRVVIFPWLPNTPLMCTSKTITSVPFETNALAARREHEDKVILHNNGILPEQSQDLDEKIIKRQRHSELMRLASQHSRPLSAPAGTLDSQPEKEPTKTKMSKRRINLSAVERQQLSRWSLDLDQQVLPDPRAPQSGLLTKGDVNETESCQSDEESTEEEEDEEPINTFRTSLPNVTPMAKVDTWKVRTLERRAKEEEMKRFCKAQSVQRRLEEIEERFRDLEQQGVELEKALREGECREGREFEERSELIGQWLWLVQEKNALVSEESDLMITTQELELEEQQSLLEMQFRCYIELDDRVKSPKDRADEAQILNMMLEVIDKRNDLITFRDEKRLNEITEQLRMAR